MTESISVSIDFLQNCGFAGQTRPRMYGTKLTGCQDGEPANLHAGKL